MTAAVLDHDRTLIDWITVTHDNGPHLAACLRGPTETLAKGLNTYRTAVRDGHGTILAADGPQPRPYVRQMSGKALQAWCAERTERVWLLGIDELLELVDAGRQRVLTSEERERHRDLLGDPEDEGQLTSEAVRGRYHRAAGESPREEGCAAWRSRSPSCSAASVPPRGPRTSRLRSTSA